MAILYALVARGSVVLAEFSATSTNASAIARQILEKIPGSSDTHVSYSQDRYIFHVKRTDGLTVLCVAEDSAGRRIPFAFLEDIHQRFVRTYGRGIHSAAAYAMNDEFSRVLSQQMDYYSNDPNADRISRLKGEMTQVRTVMIENIDKVLDRGERLELLVDKTATLQGNTLRFRRQARRFRSTVWWRNCRLMYVPKLLSFSFRVTCMKTSHAIARANEILSSFYHLMVCIDSGSLDHRLHRACIRLPRPLVAQVRIARAAFDCKAGICLTFIGDFSPSLYGDNQFHPRLNLLGNLLVSFV